VLRLAVQHLLGQVVQHVPVAAREGRDEPGRVGVAVQRQPRQLHPGDPALGAGHQRRQAGAGQVQPGLPQQRGRLFGREAQVALAQFHELPAGTQPRQRQRWVRAAGHHHPQLGRQPVEQEPEAVVDRRRIDDVVVVQHQGEPVSLRHQRVEQGGHHRLRRRLRAVQQRGDLPADPGPHPVERGGGIAPEPGRVVVAGVQRQPGDRPLAAAGRRPAAGCGGPSHRAGWSCRTRAGCTPGPGRVPCPRPGPQQPRTGKEPGPRPGNVQLGGQQVIPLGDAGRGRAGAGRLSSHRRLARSCLPKASGFPNGLL
jgi:hypothetical protein